MNNILFSLNIKLDEFKSVYSNKNFKIIFIDSIIDYKMSCILQQNKNRRIPESILEKIDQLKEIYFRQVSLKKASKPIIYSHLFLVKH